MASTAIDICTSAIWAHKIASSSSISSALPTSLSIILLFWLIIRDTLHISIIKFFITSIAIIVHAFWIFVQFIRFAILIWWATDFTFLKVFILLLLSSSVFLIKCVMICEELICGTSSRFVANTSSAETHKHIPVDKPSRNQQNVEEN